ncbi:hypothetical protein HETIRDRAFT_426864 [Heterobasidion irregulare TC 32-1]|uniref:Uncharacterized protein n=1 Tax=Heterobasidion irregulare (strain TC 32-1) TaxID=747525 RepID=W4K6L8_HETIT|nr:uncharacterized protein HETIRDRAFT_426864 [Heterobasidion irregulare TC 32-1]ETW81448.1 hypothetical protein HETIRDRAFT_426864 [Heterobasidion irregulare TC 32-1]
MSIPPAEDGIRLPPVSAGGVSMEVCVLPRKEGIWLEDGVSVDVIERKPDGDYEFTTIILSEMVWQDDHIAVFGGAGNEQQFIVVTSTFRVNSPPPLGYAMYHTFGEYIRALFSSDRKRVPASDGNVLEIARRALAGVGSMIFRRFARP